MLRADDVWFRYRHDLPWILRGEGIEIAAGEFVGLHGPSGCGKSTLGRVLAGLAHPERGDIVYDATRTTTGANPVQLVVQHAQLAMNPRWRIRDVLAEVGADPTSRSEIEQALVDPVWHDRHPHEISGGELQRVNLARALLARPRYLIADEITASLDALTQAEIWHVLVEHARRRDVGVLVVTHDRALLDTICDRSTSIATPTFDPDSDSDTPRDPSS